MSHLIRAIAAALVVSGSVGLASAAGMSLNLNSSQKQTISHDLMNVKGQSQPSSFSASVGAKLPASVSLKQLPANLSQQIPSTKNYEFAKFQNNQILIVDPKNREVVEVISGSDANTTGKK